MRCTVWWMAALGLATACGEENPYADFEGERDPAPRTRPTGPTGVAARGIGWAIEISWDDVSQAESYRVRWGLQPGLTLDRSAITVAVASPFNHLVTTTETIYYVVTYVGSNGTESRPSQEVSATRGTGPPPIPTGLGGTYFDNDFDGTASAADTISVWWDATPTATGHDIQIDESDTFTAPVQIPTTAAYLAITPAMNGTVLLDAGAYWVRARSTNTHGASDWTGAVAVDMSALP